MRSQVLSLGAAAAALTIAGCGGSTAAKKPKPKPVSASVMAQAANRAASQPGYAVQLNADLTGSSVGGTINAAGSASVAAKQTAGTFNVKVTPPGSLAALGALQTKLIVTGGSVYIQVPSSLAQVLPGTKPWLTGSLSGLASQAGQNIPGLTSTSPSAALRKLAKASTGTAQDLGKQTIAGQSTTHYREHLSSTTTGPFTVDMWVASGLPRQLEISFSSSGASGRITMTFKSFAAQPAPTPPANAGSLSAVISQVLKSGI